MATAPVINPVPQGELVRHGVPVPSFSLWLQQLYWIAFASQQSGTTANRPTTRLYVGRPYFDTSLGKPIWVLSVAAGVATWCDATGAVV